MRMPAVLFLILSAPARAHLLGGGDGGFAWLDLDPFALVLLFLAAVFHRRGMHALHARRQADPEVLRRRSRCFWIGWSALFLALASPLDALGEELFSAHMLQHEILMLIAAPLLVLSQPSSALLRGAPAWLGRAAGATVRLGGRRGLWALLTAPFAAWTVHLVGLWGWHLPGLFAAGLGSTAVHALQHLSFLLIALLFWWALLRGPAGTGGVGVLYLFTTAVHSSLLGALLTFSPRVWYPPYLDTAPAWGLSALEDQQLGGLIMWVPGGLVFIAGALWMTARALQGPAWRAGREES